MQKKIFFIGDTFRGNQESNIRHIFNLFNPLFKNYGVTTELIISEANKKDTIDSWEPEWIKSLEGKSKSLLNGIDLNNGAIVAFEISDVDKKFLDTNGVPWINFEIHPLRFLEDLHFNIQSSFIADFSAIEIPDDYLQIRANTLKARYGFPYAKRNKNLLIVGQTPIDKSIYFDGNFKKISNYHEILDKIITKFDNIDYRPHPYLTDSEEDNKLINSYSLGTSTDRDFYKIISSNRYDTICGISSSTLYESTYFGLESIFLEKRARNFGLPISYSNLLRNSHLWLNGLLKMDIDIRSYDAPANIPENYLRQVFCSWAYVPKEEELKELFFELKDQVNFLKESFTNSNLTTKEIQLQLEERMQLIDSNSLKSQTLFLKIDEEFHLLLKDAQQNYELLKQALNLVHTAQLKADQNEKLANHHIQEKQILVNDLEYCRQELAKEQHQKNELIQENKNLAQATQLKVNQVEALAQRHLKEKLIAENSLINIENELHKVHQYNHHHWVLTQQLTEKNKSLLNSISWKITSPLRKIFTLAERPIEIMRNIINKVIASSLNIFNKPLSIAIGWVLKRPMLANRINQKLLRFPHLYNHLLEIARHNGVINPSTAPINIVNITIKNYSQLRSVRIMKALSKQQLEKNNGPVTYLEVNDNV
jgi:hypothetical protein